MKSHLNILLTRSSESNRELTSLFRQRGLDVISVPMIEIADIPFSPEQIPSEVRTPMLLLTSSNATRRWLSLRQEYEEVFRIRPRGYLIVGRKSATILLEEKPNAPILAMAESLEGLQEDVLELYRRLDERGAPWLHPRKRQGRGDLLYPCSRMRIADGVENFREMGFDVLEVPLYEPILPQKSVERLPRSLAALDDHAFIVFFSPSAVDNYFALLEQLRGEDRLKRLPRFPRYAAIGPTTAEALYRHEIEDVVMPEHPYQKMLVDAIAEEMQR